MKDLGLLEAGRYLSDSKSLLEIFTTRWEEHRSWRPCISLRPMPLRYWTNMHTDASSRYNLTCLLRCQTNFIFGFVDDLFNFAVAAMITSHIVCQEFVQVMSLLVHSTFQAQLHHFLFPTQSCATTDRVKMVKVEYQKVDMTEPEIQLLPIYQMYLSQRLFDWHGGYPPPTQQQNQKSLLLAALQSLICRSPPGLHTSDASTAPSPPMPRPPIIRPGTHGLQPDIGRASMALEPAIIDALQVAPPHLVRTQNQADPYTSYSQNTYQWETRRVWR